MVKTEVGKYVDSVIRKTLGWEPAGADVGDIDGDDAEMVALPRAGRAAEKSEKKCKCHKCEEDGDCGGWGREYECECHECFKESEGASSVGEVYWKDMPKYQCCAYFVYYEDNNSIEEARVIYDVSGEGKCAGCVGENFSNAYAELNQALIVLAGIGCNVVDGKDNDDRVRSGMCAACDQKRVCWDEDTGENEFYCEEYLTAVMRADEQDRDNAGGG